MNSGRGKGDFDIPQIRCRPLRRETAYRNGLGATDTQQEHQTQQRLAMHRSSPMECAIFGASLIEISLSERV
jgi:hypothetical protein